MAFVLDKNFRLSKTAKRMIALTTDRAVREAFKQAMIEAELIAKNSERWVMK